MSRGTEKEHDFSNLLSFLGSGCYSVRIVALGAFVCEPGSKKCTTSRLRRALAGRSDFSAAAAVDGITDDAFASSLDPTLKMEPCTSPKTSLSYRTLRRHMA
jgi:hypothetical protein